jgi:hypothetical protein
MSTSDNQRPISQSEAEKTTEEPTRRDALKDAGRFAAYMTPIMVVLLSGTEAEACHSPGKDLIGCSPV